MMKLFVATTVIIGLSACSITKLPPSAVELHAVRVEIPVPMPCLRADQIPAEPERIASKLTGDAAHDLDLVSASALRLRSWGQRMMAALEACAK